MRCQHRSEATIGWRFEGDRFHWMIFCYWQLEQSGMLFFGCPGRKGAESQKETIG
jgi:hypothetical protein